VEVGAMDENTLKTIALTASAVSTIASILCNLPFIKPNTLLGRGLHFLAFNFNVGSLAGTK
jgi:hypothetical protein